MRTIMRMITLIVASAIVVACSSWSALWAVPTSQTDSMTISQVYEPTVYESSVAVSQPSEPEQKTATQSINYEAQSYQHQNFSPSSVQSANVPSYSAQQGASQPDVQSQYMPAAPKYMSSQMPQQGSSYGYANVPEREEYIVLESTYESKPKRRRAAAERRQARNMALIAQQDSLISSREFQFVPSSMQEMPSGELQFIYNFYYYVAILKDHVEVHVPTIRGGVVRYFEILNFDTFELSNYRASRTQFGWTISFNVTSSVGNIYAFAINVYTATAEAEMTLIADKNMVKYIGRIEKI